jgi:hypothetical protein
MSTDEQIQQCRNWLEQGQYEDVDKSAIQDKDFDECRSLVENSGGASRRNVARRSGGPGIFSSWGTLIFIVLALVIPIGVVAVYTNFTFQWQKKKDTSAPKK